MSTTTDTPLALESVSHAGAAGPVLYAVIKSSSKYAYQGREGGRTVAMRVTQLDETSDYPFYLENNNRYRREDLTFYVQGTEGKLLKLR